MSTDLPPAKEVDFSVRKEDWSRYLVDDGTELRIKIVVRKILEVLQPTASGYPPIGIESMNAVSAMVPDKLKREPSKIPFDMRTQQGNEIDFRKLHEDWQEYLTTDGLKILVKPVLVKVLKYDSYNIFGEPIYHVNVQYIVDTKKATENKNFNQK